MASINWAFLCDYAFISNGKASMIGLFDNIGVKAIPATHPQMFLVVSVTIIPQDGSIKFGARITSPTGGSNLAFIENPPVSVHGGVSTTNILMGFYGVSIPETGDYHVEILANGESVHLVPLNVYLVK